MKKYLLLEGSLYSLTKTPTGFTARTIVEKEEISSTTTIPEEWAFDYLSYAKYPSKQHISITETDKRTTVGISVSNKGKVKVAKARCKKSDFYSPIIGRAIVTARLLGDEVPNFI